VSRGYAERTCRSVSNVFNTSCGREGGKERGTKNEDVSESRKKKKKMRRITPRSDEVSRRNLFAEFF